MSVLILRVDRVTYAVFNCGVCYLCAMAPYHYVSYVFYSIQSRKELVNSLARPLANIGMNNQLHTHMQYSMKHWCMG